MDYIVLVKQVPDISNIPAEAWDWEKGTLKRGLLDNVCNELDRQALALALGLREKLGGKIVALTMGPPFAAEVLRYAMSAGADSGVLLTDRKLGGADTAATAYPLAQAVKKIEKDILKGRRDYLVISGMQSVDGDTAQVPPQVAEELGISHVAYATAFSVKDGQLHIRRITRRGTETVMLAEYPCVVTVIKWTEPPNASFSRTRWAALQQLHTWSAADVSADDSRIGLAGSRTTVLQIFSPKDVSNKTCVFETDMKKLVKMIREAFLNKSEVTATGREEPDYMLPEDKKTRYSGEVWVFMEQEGGVLNQASLELLGKATQLAQDLKVEIGAVLVGEGVGCLVADIAAHGAGKIYIAEHGLLKNFLPLPYTKVVAEMAMKYRPQILLFGATPMGRELAPRVAYRTEAGLTADCTGLNIMDFRRGQQEAIGVLKQTRPALGGNIMASIITQNSELQMSTVRPGVLKALEPDSNRKGDVITYHPDIKESELGAWIVSAEGVEMTTDITESGVIACGGAGCRTRENFERYLEPLAAALGDFTGEKAEVGASRAAVESGFIDRSHQVGQTGHTVKPRIYVAVGVSGAVQHLTGMQNSDIVVAINKDHKAPIFKVADFGVVADLEEAVPELIEALKSAEKVVARP